MAPPLLCAEEDESPVARMPSAKSCSVIEARLVERPDAFAVEEHAGGDEIRVEPGTAGARHELLEIGSQHAPRRGEACS